MRIHSLLSLVLFVATSFSAHLSQCQVSSETKNLAYLFTNSTDDVMAATHMELDLDNFNATYGELEYSNITGVTLDNYGWFKTNMYAYEQLNEGTQLTQRTKIQDIVTWIPGGSNCIAQTVYLWVGIWNSAYDIWLSSRNNDCGVKKGQIGGIYYRYWSKGSCNTTVMQKTIVGATYAAMNRQESGWLCNNYCISMNHGGDWTGVLILGPSRHVWGASCAGEYKATFDASRNQLIEPYRCNSQSA